jgi:uncharacterized protein (TIGR00730 family)
MKTVCVFCSSSNEVSTEIKESGALMGEATATSGFALLYGGTSCGLMKVVADAYKAKGRKLVGIVPTYMKEEGRLYEQLDETIFVDELGPRKQVMLEKSDFIVALPGGIGTYDEFIDLLSLKAIGRHKKPMYLLNTGKYFEPLVYLIRHGVENKTIKPECLDLFKVYDKVDDLMTDIMACS